MSGTATGFAPVAAATGNEVSLAMQRLWLTGQVLPAGARLRVEHVFQSAESQPLEVVYCFPLPRDAALRRFRIIAQDFTVDSELQPTETAVKTYEQGIAQGSLAALARQYGDGLINLSVGNIRPRETVTVILEIVAGVELRDDGYRFRFPFTLSPTYHSRAKAAVTAPGEAELELPTDEFGDVLLPRFRENPAGLHAVGFDLSVQGIFDEIASPSHSARVRRADSATHVSLAAEADVPNRDLVLDARRAEVQPQALAGRTPDGKIHFAAIIPSTSFGANPNSPRRVAILLDRSGSMQGVPIAQARKAIEACLAALSESDSFGLVAFDDRIETFQPSLVPGTRENRDRARDFLSLIDARGGTELAKGVQAAAQVLSREGGDILILTDGQVSGTEQILEQARSTGIRLHCLGIGSASQDRFLALLARETDGVSRFVTPRERVDMAAVDLFASMGRPVASGLQTGANIQPAPPSVVYSGTPVLLFGESDNEAPVELTWSGGKLSLPIAAESSTLGETVWLLQGARLITDWESRYPAQDALAPLDKRQQNRIAQRLKSLSETYSLASREMSLVAVVKRPGDHPGDLPKTQIVPVGMPQDIDFGAYFGLPGAPSATAAFAAMIQPVSAPMPTMPPPAAPASGGRAEFTRMFQASAPAAPPPAAGPLSRLKQRFRKEDTSSPLSDAAAPEDILLALAGRLESDGGMPGKNQETRAAATVAALLAFVSEGHTLTSGAFRTHVARLVEFLKSVHGLTASQQAIVDRAIEAAHTGNVPPAGWLALAQSPRWKSLEPLMRS